LVKKILSQFKYWPTKAKGVVAGFDRLVVSNKIPSTISSKKPATMAFGSRVAKSSLLQNCDSPVIFGSYALKSLLTLLQTDEAFNPRSLGFLATASRLLRILKTLRHSYVTVLA